MSYGIVRVQKMTAGSVKGIEIHDRREKEGISHTNKDIDWNRTDSNYDLHPDQQTNFNKAVKQRISQLELTRAVRKDAVVLAQCLVTSDHSFFEKLTPDQTKQFFKDSYDFLADRYGRENIISSTVHMDERTPHMHFNFVPVTADGRLSAKAIFNRTDLIRQQDDFFQAVGSRYNLARGERGGIKTHLESADLKKQTLQKEIDTLQQEAKALRGTLKHMRDIDSIPVKTSLTGDKVTLSAEDYGKIKVLAKQSNRMIEDNLKMRELIKGHKDKKSIEVTMLRAEIKQLREQIANPRANLVHLKPDLER